MILFQLNLTEGIKIEFELGEVIDQNTRVNKWPLQTSGLYKPATSSSRGTSSGYGLQRIVGKIRVVVPANLLST